MPYAVAEFAIPLALQLPASTGAAEPFLSYLQDLVPFRRKQRTPQPTDIALRCFK